MYNFEEYSASLTASINSQNFQIQIQIISELIAIIEESNNNERVIQDILRTNLGSSLNDVISSQLSILMPSLKLIRHLMKDFHFRNYQFINIFKSIIRVLILFVQNNSIDKSQLEFFEIVVNLDVLFKKYLLKESSQRKNEDLQAVFVCVLKFVELVNCEKCIPKAIQNLTIEIYLQALSLIETHNCVFKNFHLTMKVFHLADVFMDNLFEKYNKDAGELWLFKIIEILFGLLRACNESDGVQVKCFENMFYGRISSVLKRILAPDSSESHSELFKFCIAILNTILWTPFFSRLFCTQILKKIVKLKAETIIFSLSKSSRKVRKYTQYSMKLFLTSFIVYSDGCSANNHLILETFLQTCFPKSMIDLTPSEIVQNSKTLILLYGCSFFKQQLRRSINANRVLENLAIVLQNMESNIDSAETWEILRIFAYFSNYAFLSALEYAGVQKISENLLIKASEFLLENKGISYPVDKYLIYLSEHYVPNAKMSNAVIVSYICQDSPIKPSKIVQIIPSSKILPFISSTDYNQVVNAVLMLQKKHLKVHDLDFIVKHCFCDSRSKEINIEGALSLVSKNSRIISGCSAVNVFKATIAFLEGKQKTPKLSALCYYLMMTTCVNLLRFSSNLL